MEHEHNDLSWNATLALMARLLSESNENKSNYISKLITYEDFLNLFKPTEK